jgi:tRNA threonylcarbamoyladenosine biosynthesis protein TsaB
MTRASPVILALDASTETLVIALGRGAEATRGLETEGGAQASARMIPAALQLLAEAGLSLADVDAIAFARGPGAFTGLRTACAVAQGLAFGAGKPVLSIDSLLIVAEDARQQGAPEDLWIAMDARMGELYAAHYRAEAAGWRTVQGPALYAPEALQVQWEREGTPRAVAGSGLGLLPEPPALAYPMSRSRSQALAALALAAWTRGETLDAAEALPVYVRDKVALTTAEREARAA